MNLQTIGQIARAEGIPTSRVAYAIETYKIEPTQRAGVLRLFDQTSVAAIRSALRRIREHRQQAGPAPTLLQVMQSS